MRHHEEHFFSGAAYGGDHHEAQRDAPREGREVSSEGQVGDFWRDDECICGEAHDDGGDSVEHVSGEADGLGKFSAASEFGKEDARADSDWNANHARDGEQNTGTKNCVGHAAAGFADGFWNFREEVEIERAGAHVKQVDEDGNERCNDENGCEDRQGGDNVVGHRPQLRS